MQPYQNLEEKKPLAVSQAHDSDRDRDTNAKRQGSPGTTGTTVVFETPSKYDWALWTILLFVLLSCLIPLYKIFADDTIPAPDKRNAMSTLLWTLVALALVFALVLPTSLQVRSNGSVGICTIFRITWSFGNIRAVELEHSLCSKRSFRHARLKFATSWTGPRVLVQRQQGGWDILVSPREVDDYVKAVRSVIVTSNA